MTDAPMTPDSPRAHPLATGFRTLLALGALGMAIGGTTLIAEGLFHVGSGLAELARQTATASISSRIMKATDELLFGIVLIIFASNIAFGFCLDSIRAAQFRIPTFMSARSIPALKATFCQVIVVYLIVDFATDILADANKLDVSLLYFPAAIGLISAALRLLPHAEDEKQSSQANHDPS